MASPAAILRASKAVPAGGRPAPPPQGWNGQFGNGYAPSYGPFLPRPPETFTAGAFAPFSPILPVPLDQPPPGFARPQPRRWIYRPGYNLPVGEPGSDGYKLTSFATLKQLADAYSILRTCLEIRKNEIRALDWDIVLTPDAAKAYRGDRAAMRDFGERQAKAKKWFRKPDPNYFSFSSWLHAMMDQVFVYDALSLYLCPKKGSGRGGGLLGSGLDSLWVVDGASIRPLVDLHGGTPMPPAPGYEQYGYGVPRSDYTTMIDGTDLRDAGFSREDLKGEFRGDQLLYLPYLPRTDSPYGFGLVEQAVIPIMTGLRKQAYQLSFFDESTIPAVYISPGDVNMTANQIRELQDALNALAGDIAWRYKVIVLPPGSKTMPQKDIAIVDQSDEWIATEVCMVANINPMEVGILPRVSTVASPFAAREMAQAQRSIHARTSTKPTLKYVTEIMDVILQVVCGQQDMRFIFSGMEEEQDLAAMTDMKVKQVQSALSSIDEARDALNIGPPWGTDETSGPVVFTAAGPLPLGQGGTDAATDQMAAEGGGNESLTDAHAASEGAHGANGNGSAAAAGTSGRGRMNGPVTQRQARRGGSLAPAHATGEGAPGASGGPVAKAASAELEALARHLRKGMPVTQWEPRNLPGHALAVISEDLAKGLTPDQAVGIARTLILGKAADPEDQRRHDRDRTRRDQREDRQEAAQRQGAAQVQQAQARQQQMQALARQYAPRIAQALNGLAKAILKLVKAWMAGTLAVTAAVLAGMIRDLVAKALAGILPGLWRDGWALGDGSRPGADDLDWQAQIAQWNIGTVGAISDTRISDVMALIQQAVRERWSARELAQRIKALLDSAGRADAIARSEVARAVMAATLRNFRDAGVTYVTWHVHSQHPCAKCLKAQASPPLPLGTPFPGTNLASPPAHPSCACSLNPAEPPKTLVTAKEAKAMRRRVGLNGEAFLSAFAEDGDGNAAGGGARGVMPHLADGTQVPGGSAGVSPGGEPPRWNGSEPFPGDRWVDGGRDDEQGGERDSGTPATYWPSPHYMDGHWPQGGHGTQQVPASSPGAAAGRPPNSVGKAADAAARFLKGAPKVKASVVYRQMRGNFPAEALGWVKQIRWVGPVELPLSLLDFANSKEWAAHHQQAKVDSFARQLEAGEKVNPIIGIVKPGHNHVRIPDGRHRASAARKLGRPVRAYVGFVDTPGSHPSDKVYLYQEHSGSDPANKSFTAGAGVSPGAVSGLAPFNLPGQSGKVSKESVRYRPADPEHFRRRCGTCVMFRAGGTCTLVEGTIVPTATCDRWEPRAAKSAGAPYVAGLMVRAADTGRVLMLQRSLDDDQDHAAGKWEPPGGHAEPGETLLQAALREFAEETGMQVPRGSLTGSWDASNGIYRGYVLTVPSEDAVDIFGDRDQVFDPDDPHGDHHQAIAWFDPRQFADNPSMRPEMGTDLSRVLEALSAGVAKSAETPMLEATPHILGPHGLWHTPDRHVPSKQKLPNYIEHIAAALMRDQGLDESTAIAYAVNAVKRWAAGDLHWGHGKVTPEVRAASQRALNEWEELRASHR